MFRVHVSNFKLKSLGQFCRFSRASGDDKRCVFSRGESRKEDNNFKELNSNANKSIESSFIFDLVFQMNRVYTQNIENIYKKRFNYTYFNM